MLKVERNPSLKPLPTKRIVIASFNEGEITQKENDKIPFTAAGSIENMILWKDNLETRPGSVTLSEDVGIIDIAKVNTNTDAKLLTFSIDGATKEINLIDRETGDITSHTAPNVTVSVDWANGNETFYYCYGTGLSSFDTSTGVSTALVGATPNFITYAENRLWSAGDDGLKYSTIGAVAHSGDNFSSDMGTYDVSTGIYPYGVTHGGVVSTGDMLAYTGLVSVGKKVVVFSQNQLQVHEIPDAEFATFIDEKRSTLKFESSHGIKSKSAVRVIGEFVYFANDDGFFKLDVERKRVTPLNKNITKHQTFDWANAALGYNKKWNAVLLSCKRYGVNDITMVYFIDYNAFTFFTNIQPKKWIELEDDIYILDFTGKKILKAFGEDIWTDDELPINYLMTTAAIDGNLPEFYKKTQEIFLDVASEGETTVKLDIYHDRLFGEGKDSSLSSEIEFSSVPISYGAYLGSPFGDAPMGMGAITNNDGLIEKKERVKNRAKFAHIEIQVSGACDRRVSLRRIILTYQETPKKIKNMALY